MREITETNKPSMTEQRHEIIKHPKSLSVTNRVLSSMACVRQSLRRWLTRLMRYISLISWY